VAGAAPADHLGPRPPVTPSGTAKSSETATPIERRRADLERLVSETWDVLVVGGGVTGSGAALDASSRGLSVALVERSDIAAGTSSRSSRLIHGGLRYLQQFRFGLVREALAERSRLLRLAPHLVRLEPLMFPLYGTILARPFYGSGLTLYDLLGASRDGGRHRHLGLEEAVASTPALRRKGLRGAFVFHDGVEDDARLALAVARTAQARGALVLTRTRVTAPILEAGRIAGARARDELGGEDLEIRSRAVIDATGVWSGRPEGAFPARAAANGDARTVAGAGEHVLRPSRGTHLIVRRERVPSATGLTIRAPGKVVFLVPWPGHWLIGTTDVPYDGPPDGVVPTPDDVDEILAAANRTLDVDLTRDDVVGAYAGLRPLVADGAVSDGLGGSESTLKVSREHRVRIEADGLARIGGGKYTTYRVMAADVLDAALDAAFGLGTARSRPSRTADLPLMGAASTAELDVLAARLTPTLVACGLERRHADRLVARHGTQAADVVALGERLDLLQPIAKESDHPSDHLEAEVIWAAREELALGLDDVLVRRTRLAQEMPDRAEGVAPRVASLLGQELGWDQARQSSEIARFLDGAHREFDVPPRPSVPRSSPPTLPRPSVPRSSPP
jgi:glycerol-3-phosphate dehydrogenase